MPLYESQDMPLYLASLVLGKVEKAGPEVSRNVAGVLVTSRAALFDIGLEMLIGRLVQIVYDERLFI